MKSNQIYFDGRPFRPCNLPHQPAFHYLKYTEELFDKSIWKTHYFLALNFFNYLVQAAFSNHSYEEFLNFSDQVIRYAKKLLDSFLTYSMKVSYYAHIDQFENAQATA